MFKNWEFDVTHDHMHLDHDRCPHTAGNPDTCLYTLVHPSNLPPVGLYIEWKANIDLTQIAGDRKKLNRIRMVGMGEPAWALGDWYQRLTIDLDGTRIWGPEEVKHGDRSWVKTVFHPNLDLDGHNTLTIVITQGGVIVSGGVGLHCAEITVAIEYDAFEEPEKCDVRIYVKNGEDKPLSSSFVRLLSNSRVIRSGYTDGGFVEFVDVYEGGYTVRASKKGYYTTDGVVEVYPPSVEYTMTLYEVEAPPPVEIPWGMIIAAVVLIGGGYLLLKEWKKKKPEVEKYVTRAMMAGLV